MFTHSFSIFDAAIALAYGTVCPTATAEEPLTIPMMVAGTQGTPRTDIAKTGDVASGALSAAEESEHASTIGDGTRYSLRN